MRPPEEIKRGLVMQWLAKADEDFGVAEHFVFENSPYLNAIGFHAQQAAEKYLKAFLVHSQIEFPKSHDIDRLLNLVATVDKNLSEPLRDAVVLTDYAVEVRYPVDLPEITPLEAREALSLAKRVREAVKHRLAPPPVP
ncbi:MAG: HEPN domain-containing protein [Acidobacteria bacterium]|nr:HEPN domain-containing protein [Acidobacteriota bacterium]